jgi:hypothetical protein
MLKEQYRETVFWAFLVPSCLDRSYLKVFELGSLFTEVKHDLAHFKEACFVLAHYVLYCTFSHIQSYPPTPHVPHPPVSRREQWTLGYNECDFFKKIKNTDPLTGATFKSATHLLYMFFDFLRPFLRIWLQSLKNTNMT